MWTKSPTANLNPLTSSANPIAKGTTSKSALIAGLILSPSSKLALSRHLSGKSTTLAEELSLSDTLTEDDLYRAMKWLGQHQERIQKSLATRHLGEDSLILYDLSPSYYE